MAQFDLPTLNPQVTNGTQLATFLNSWKPALQSQNAGAARPDYAIDGMVWVEQVSGVEWNLLLVSGAEDVRIGTLDPTTGVFSIAGLADYVPLAQKGVANGVATLGAGGTIPDAQIPAAIARDAEVTAAINAHAAAGDPHPTYLTAAEGNAAYEALGAVAAHAAAGDPHPVYLTAADGNAVYVPLTQRGAVNGVATLDGAGTIPDAQIPAAIARDAEVTAAISTHAAAADPHPIYLTAAEGNAAYVPLTQRGAANGIATLDAGGTIPDAQIPGAIARDAEVTAAINAHAAAGDPHPTYLTAAEGNAAYEALGAIAAHAAAADPHAGYQKESEKAVANGYASLDAGGTIPDAQIPAAIARDAEVTAAINAHVAAGDPHPTYLTAAEGNAAYEALGAIATHAAAADPHAGYQKESEKAVANGYASLDAGGTIPDAQIPAAIARDAEVTTAVSNHAAAADPHTGYQKESEKAVANGYASLDATGKVPATQLPAAGAAPGVVYLGEQIASNSASLDFTGLTGYSAYRFIFMSVMPAAAGGYLVANFSSNGGASYDGSSVYGYDSGGLSNGTHTSITHVGLNAATHLATASNVGTAAGHGVTGEMLTGDLRAATTGKLIYATFHVIWWSAGNFVVTADGGGGYTPLVNVNAIRWTFHNGNIASGRITCYGYL